MMSALELANYIVVKCVADDEPITNLQLQKILYYIQGRHLSIFNVPAFIDEIEAWKFGPVVPKVYYAFCHYGAMPIIRIGNNTDFDEDVDRDLVDRTIEEKRNMDPWDLVTETHKEGGAWETIFNGGVGYRRYIPKDLIRRDFADNGY
ncbi:MAG: DUF4065 domain-containing protein [Lachnospiraceae bacterium]|nr:DUF4065 domain-containing protein [Ruminococcus sp.]MCM1276910.1 DUF4065 domain-containing protein [Lachnospiraceae bacterium]